MEPAQFLTEYIQSLQEAIQKREDVIIYLVSGIVFMAGVVGAFFFIYRNEKRKSDEMFKEMHKEYMENMKKDTEAKIDLKNAIINNTKVVDRIPEMIKAATRR
jgi:hypothetical protein